MVTTSKSVYLTLYCVLSIFIGICVTNDVNCRKCKAGFYVKQQCITDQESFHDTICTPCSSGFFMSTDENLETECTSCSICASGFYTISSCTATHDTQCESCDKKVASDSYRTSCESGNVQSSDLSISDEKSLKLDTIEEPGSGSDIVNVVSPGNFTVIDSDLIASDNETEGSGEVILEIPPESEIVIDEKTTKSTVPISHIVTEVKDDDLIPVSASSTTTGKTEAPIKSTTVKTDAPTKITTPAVVTTPQPSKSQPTVSTTEKTLDLGVGIKLTNEASDDTKDEKYEVVTDVQVETPQQEKTKANEVQENNHTPVRSPVSERKSAMTDDSDKVSIGIVIAVAIIAALVFFVIGFIVSKYCRRRRQRFKMMTKNGGTHNGSKPVMIDITSNTYRPTGIYDEIGKEANGTCSSERLDEIKPQHTENYYAVPDKPKKRESDVPDIKFIDETDEEVDVKDDKKLYANTESQDDISPPTPNGDASHSHDEVEDSIDENSPMLSEIQSEIRNSREDHETDALVEKS